MRPTAPANAAASLASSRWRPDSTSIPSAPREVETTGLAIAIASRILKRVPPPMRSGAIDTAALERCGRTSSTCPDTSTRGPRKARISGVGCCPTILSQAGVVLRLLPGEVELDVVLVEDQPRQRPARRRPRQPLVRQERKLDVDHVEGALRKERIERPAQPRHVEEVALVAAAREERSKLQEPLVRPLPRARRPQAHPPPGLAPGAR